MTFYQKTTLLFLLVLSCSCNGQKQTEIPKDNSNKTDVSKKDSITFSPFFQASKSDSLFFIEGQLCQHLRRIFEDSKGNLWFGTNVYGLMRYDGEELEYFDEKDGIGIGRITAIVEEKSGNIWFGTSGGLTMFNGESFINYTENEGLLKNEIWSILIDKNETFWIGTNVGISRFDGEKFTNFNMPKAKIKDTTTYYSYDRVTSILEDKKGALWFGTDGFGITKYDGKNFTFITKEQGLPGNSINEIFEDTNGNIWIGTMYGGVSMYNGTDFKNFTEEGKIDGIEISDIYEDTNSNIWIAVENHGIYRYNGKEFTNYYKENGLLTNGVLSILKDSKDHFWFGGWGGLFKFDGNTFTTVTKNGPWD